MAERLKEKLIEREKVVDVVCGPDAYRSLPNLLDQTLLSSDRKGINTLLSMDETYADITPLRYDTTNRRAFVSIMRGCNNMCTFCIVPFTRGRERSRSVDEWIDEQHGNVSSVDRCRVFLTRFVIWSIWASKVMLVFERLAALDIAD